MSILSLSLSLSLPSLSLSLSLSVCLSVCLSLFLSIYLYIYIYIYIYIHIYIYICVCVRSLAVNSLVIGGKMYFIITAGNNIHNSLWNWSFKLIRVKKMVWIKKSLKNRNEGAEEKCSRSVLHIWKRETKRVRKR